jgi:Uma2 family endonuclease
MTLTTGRTAAMTAEEYLRLPDSRAYELVGEQLVERHTGAEASEIGARIIFLIGIFLRSHRLGRVFNSEASYQCYPDDPGKFRRPDVSFVRFDRLPDGQAPKGQIRVAPDLVVEVISPGDVAEDVEEKVNEYLGAGVPLICVVYPSTRTVRLHRPRSAPAGPISNLSGDDVITGENVLPGFTCPVREFFDDAPTA